MRTQQRSVSCRRGKTIDSPVTALGPRKDTDFHEISRRTSLNLPAVVHVEFRRQFDPEGSINSILHSCFATLRHVSRLRVEK
ncbi:hypothetical protein F2P81_004150 [Scophthalmus maximus]|uniref:Uncharacterized protein n=1 Tax=Scophthalmus maximus TaxID=52904 RepID=A0A6A4T9R2_SCOMX|nr:hypothetical protein F2P81_004150 [Scophthalmus maximus]